MHRFEHTPESPTILWLLIWGGGDEPENPAIYVCATRERALALAREKLGELPEPWTEEFEHVLRMLDNQGEAEAAGAADAFMRIESTPLYTE